MIIDFHAHVFPDPLDQIGLPKAPIREMRRNARTWLRPVSWSLHKAQTFLRHLPEPARKRLDKVSGIAPILGLLVESSTSDLMSSMEEANVDRALIIAHPPVISNEFVLETAKAHPNLVPVATLARGALRPAAQLKRLFNEGVQALQIHPPADGEGPNSQRYKALLKTASELGLPVILHTGSVNSHLLFKDPAQGRAERYIPWFKTFTDIRFVLAHMNIHEPNIALDLAEEFPNLYVGTSWQPAEMIGEAVRRIGAERVIFGSDWPFIGGNLQIGLGRVRECLSAGTLNESQAELILGLNAAKLLGRESGN